MFSQWIFPDGWQVLVMAICAVLHQRPAWRLGTIITGIIFAKGRKTITSWLRSTGISRRYKAFYYFIVSVGKKTEVIATALFKIVISCVPSIAVALFHIAGRTMKHLTRTPALELTV